MAEHNGQELCGGQSGRTVLVKPVDGSLGLGKLFDGDEAAWLSWGIGFLNYLRGFAEQGGLRVLHGFLPPEQ